MPLSEKISPTAFLSGSAWENKKYAILGRRNIDAGHILENIVYLERISESEITGTLPIVGKVVMFKDLTMHIAGDYEFSIYNIEEIAPIIQKLITAYEGVPYKIKHNFFRGENYG